MLLVARFENVLAGLHTLVLDSTEAIERIENGLKVTNDVCWHGSIAPSSLRFREEAWRKG